MKKQFLQILFIIIITNMQNNFCVSNTSSSPYESYNPKKIQTKFESITSKNNLRKKPLRLMGITHPKNLNDWDIIDSPSSSPDSDWDVIDSPVAKTNTLKNVAKTNLPEEKLEQKNFKGLDFRETLSQGSIKLSERKEYQALLENLKKTIQDEEQKEFANKAIQDKTTYASEFETKLNELKQTAQQNEESLLRQRIEYESSKKPKFSDFINQKQKEKQTLIDQEKQNRAALQTERTKFIQDMVKQSNEEQLQMKIEKDRNIKESLAKNLAERARTRKLFEEKIKQSLAAQKQEEELKKLYMQPDRLQKSLIESR